MKVMVKVERRKYRTGVVDAPARVTVHTRSQPGPISFLFPSQGGELVTIPLLRREG